MLESTSRTRGDQIRDKYRRPSISTDRILALRQAHPRYHHRQIRRRAPSPDSQWLPATAGSASSHPTHDKSTRNGNEAWPRIDQSGREMTARGHLHEVDRQVEAHRGQGRHLSRPSCGQDSDRIIESLSSRLLTPQAARARVLGGAFARREPSGRVMVRLRCWSRCRCQSSLWTR